MRGEQSKSSSLTGLLIGSPPLARGTVCNLPIHVLHRRITPACAGNRQSYNGRARAVEDHPRLRGEQLIRSNNTSKIKGSPPLARGTAAICIDGGSGRGITPACAGNSSRLQQKRRADRDHPRLRGEQRIWFRSYRLRLGSPPLARGTAAVCAYPFRQAGITPACAGNRSRPKSTGGTSWDHPRLRGEQVNPAAAHAARKGSPPLARGTVLIRLERWRWARITPACAGNRRCFCG